jgi:hypothetical protein
LKQEENKLRLVALRTTSNVNALTRDFFHKPPSFKTNVSLSWKPASARPVVQGRDRLLKRKAIAFEDEGKHVGRPLYEPPGGKYSNRLDKYAGPPRGRGGPRFRGGRGRGGSRGGYGRFGRS